MKLDDDEIPRSVFGAGCFLGGMIVWGLLGPTAGWIIGVIVFGWLCLYDELHDK